MHEEDWKVHPGALGPGTEVGSWRVVERLGVGGYGAVYRVEDLACPGDFYALKLALRQGDERAEREVQLLMSRAVHPNVVRLYACGRWPHPRTGYLYFVMDWVPGPVLHTWVETVNPPFRLLAEKVGKVAVALGALHDRRTRRMGRASLSALSCLATTTSAALSSGRTAVPTLPVSSALEARMQSTTSSEVRSPAIGGWRTTPTVQGDRRGRLGPLRRSPSVLQPSSVVPLLLALVVGSSAHAQPGRLPEVPGVRRIELE
ncbi:phosphotransferase [Pyxidicoccus caerfyrddinensis]|uniref:phosphotransferase n=1 Tax=Pyxidicoccus caerfyrddinensis TaxID=2709663 RepID=UPI001F0857D6|nr:phosphotransferase [Pyxidicoccus caerfyrddinensis]